MTIVSAETKNPPTNTLSDQRHKTDFNQDKTLKKLNYPFGGTFENLLFAT